MLRLAVPDYLFRELQFPINIIGNCSSRNSSLFLVKGILSGTAVPEIVSRELQA